MRFWVRLGEFLHSVLASLLLLIPMCFFFIRVFELASGKSLEILSSPQFFQALKNSLYLTLGAAFSSTILGFVFAWILWRYEWPVKLKSFFEILLKLPYLLPPFFFAMGWIALAAPRVGYLNQCLLRLGLPELPSIYGLGAATFVLALWSTALSVIQFQVFFKQFPGSLEDAAILCGASPIRTLLKITLPLAKRQVLSNFLLISINALAAFGVPAMLASPKRTYVLTTKIFQSIKSSPDFSQAAILSLTLIVITILFIVGQNLILRRKNKTSIVTGKASRPSALIPSSTAKLFFFFLGLFSFCANLLPIGAVVVQSFLEDRSDLTSFSLEKYRYVFTQVPDGLSAIQNSFGISFCAAGLATFLALILAYGSSRFHSRMSRLLSEGWSLGYALPGTILALALLVFYARSLANTVWIIAIAYFVKYSAFSIRVLTPALGNLSNELEEAGWMSGASPFATFRRLLIPIIFPALSAAFFLSFIPMLSELTMSVFLVGAGTETLGSLIYRLQEYADPGAASVLAVSLAAVILGMNLLLRRLSRGNFGI